MSGPQSEPELSLTDLVMKTRGPDQGKQQSSHRDMAGQEAFKGSTAVKSHIEVWQHHRQRLPYTS